MSGGRVLFFPKKAVYVWRRIPAFTPQEWIMFGEGILILPLPTGRNKFGGGVLHDFTSTGRSMFDEGVLILPLQTKYVSRRRPDFNSTGRSMFDEGVLILPLQAKYVSRRRPDFNSTGQSMFGGGVLILPLLGEVCLAKAS